MIDRGPAGAGAGEDLIERLCRDLDILAEIVVVVLDEVDSIGDKHDILYSIPQARKQGDVKNTKLGIIGITNDSTFLSNLDPKVKSSQYDSVIQFDAYESEELQQILSRRADRAFVDGAVDDSAISLCAAFAAQDKGSARQAIDYLYEAGEVALDHSDDLIVDDHVREAEERVEKPNLCSEIGVNKLAFDRMWDLLLELDMIGTIDGKKRTGDGQGGEKYYWEMSTGTGTTIEVLESISRLDDVIDIVVSSAQHSNITNY
ncbi:Cdc6/Cdc18 family protein [Haloarcula quadrata]|uniref:Cdc6/Cdc18 family protein n=1 Tax=Haloarcula quadrata TaxID=182779 RepID=UPI000EB4B07A|nr:hypothetical protein [Haloarcula quadrata]